MKFKYETHNKRKQRLNKWHPYFLLFPRLIDSHVCWLMVVERRCIFHSSTGPDGVCRWSKHYRLTGGFLNVK